ncbi:hypothetical protein SAMN05216346_102169 [Streptococcus equinus]|nr:hypothetical protein SAMN05216346_102169 [Streptococcus equinus]
MQAVELLRGFIYFKKSDKIEIVGIPEFGSVTFKVQNGEIVASETMERKQYKNK